MTTTRTEPEAAADRGVRRTVATAALGTFLAMTVFAAPLAIVGQIATDLGTGPSGQSWILSSMSLGLTVAMLTCGALGDDFGRRRLFVIGSLIFAVASAVCVVAPNAWVFVAGRIAEGFGMAAVMACGLAAMGHAAPSGAARAKSSAIWGACMGAGPAVGPVLAAACVEVFGGWRLTFVVFTVAGLLLAVLGQAFLTESRSGHARTVDLPGALLLGVGLACLLAALTEGRSGWTQPQVLALFGGALVFLVIFVVLQLRSRGPMVDLRLFRGRQLSAATIGAFVSGAGVIALLSFSLTLLQKGFAATALAASVLMLAWAATGAVISLLTRKLGERVSGTVRMAGGLVLCAVGMAMLATLTTASSSNDVLLGFFVAGVGTGLVNATLGREAVASVPVTKSGMGSGINNTARYLGSAVGVTLVSVISVTSAHEPIGELVSGWNTSAILCAAISLAGALAVMALGRPRRSVVNPQL